MRREKCLALVRLSISGDHIKACRKSMSIMCSVAVGYGSEQVCEWHVETSLPGCGNLPAS